MIFTLREALAYLDNLEVYSSKETEDEDDKNLRLAQIFIQPPVNVTGEDASVLIGNQLLKCAALEIKITKGKVVRGNDDEQNKTNDNSDFPLEPKNKKEKIKGQAYQ